MLIPDNNVLLDWVDPVNRLHDLNRGLFAWFMCVPGATGGSKLVDLNRVFPGTLTAMDVTTCWRGTKMPGAFGELDFDGVDDYVEAGGSILFDGLTQLTMWARLRFRSRGSYESYIGKRTGDTNRFTMGVGGAGVGSSAAFAINCGNGANSYGYADSTMANDTDYHLIATFNGAGADNAARLQAYINGVAVTLTYASTIPASLGTNTGNFILGNETGQTRFFDGQLAEAGVKAQWTSPEGARLLYEEARSGYPNLLRRVELDDGMDAPAAGGGITGPLIGFGHLGGGGPLIGGRLVRDRLRWWA